MTFAPPTRHDLACGGATDVVAGDLDGDGIDDVVAGGTCINLLRGTSDGLDPAEIAATEAATAPLAIGRIDTINPEASTDALDVLAFTQPVRLFTGNGDGTLEAHIIVDAGSPNHRGTVRVSDLVEGPALDLVTASAASITIRVGHGDGLFDMPHTVSVGAVVQTVAVGDVVGDPHRDLVAATNGGVFILPHLGAGAFSSPTLLDETGDVRDVVLAHLDEDDCLDVAGIEGHADFAGDELARLLILHNDCAGGFTITHTVDTPGVSALAAADLDGDGYNDIAVVGSTGLLVMRGRGDATLDDPITIALDTSGPLVLADVTGDGKKDVVVVAGGRVVAVQNTSP